ncbi:acetyltransferase (GNAT) family protein [Stackebrandtia endophytica]|uniref:Acetyltransferase (GNAT) family protein n=1 Tax=Stackebrandtia endophytica TaxID=1496996 RepID=A0A543AVJ6_9ACTN|nr:GNAT family N-acetyltransferase [Stackebrandtia endophytica]TQL76613.1 acetyltransferase (GNAT) family protein [Stackebrandtia endophytica]
MTAAITVATADQAGEVAGLIAEAFAALEVAEWLVPDDRAERLAALTGQFTILVEHAHRHGRIETIRDDGLVAASVWIDYTTAVPEPPNYERRLSEAVGDRLDRFAILDTAFEKHHPEAAHHHLAFLAVAPDRQGSGMGTALLDSHNVRLDRLGVPSYLEASNTRNRELYRRHGYRPMDEVLQLPDGPAMYPMWRDPS